MRLTIALLCSTYILLLLILPGTHAAKNRCYSCASTNMQEDFLTKNRGPQKRIVAPKMFDNFCDLDVWIIKERSSVDCEGACFKWQQIVNNSGSFSYMTLRACYASMFDSNDPATAPESEESYCSSRSTSLDCLTDANVIEDFCWCQGDYCNGATAWKLSSNFISMLVLLYLLAFS